MGPRSSMVLPTVSVLNCYGICSSRIYSGHRQLKSRQRKLRRARTEHILEANTCPGDCTGTENIAGEKSAGGEFHPGLPRLLHRYSLRIIEALLYSSPSLQ